MPISTFKGGIHPPYRKLSKDEKIEFAPLPDRVFLFLTQSAGAPPKRLVEQGQDVKTGQKIAEISGFISSNLHSPITGVVREIKKMTHHIYGKPDEVIVIERTGEDEWEKMEEMDWKDLESKVIIERIKEAGIVGLGGAAFPTHVKLTPPKDKKIDTLIINGAECEPYLTIDHRLMLEKAEEIVEGIRIISKVLGNPRVMIGIEDNKMDAVDEMKKHAEKYGMEVFPLKTKYPQGSEKHLIKVLTGREVPSGGLPLDVGVVVQNVGTALAVKEAVVNGKPLIERGLTITGGGVKEKRNVVARIGTQIEDLINFAGGFVGNVKRIVLGGPMMGIAIPNTTLPIVKGTSGILVLTEEEIDRGVKRNCINCGRCVEVCPMNLMPNRLYKLTYMKRYDQAYEEGLFDCIECGSCTYICPSKIDHVKFIKLGKRVYSALRRGKK